jgi:hypothetical protein
MDAIDDELDRRDWPFERRFRALTYTFRVRSDLPDVGPFLERLLAAFREDGADGADAIDDVVTTYTLTSRRSSGTQRERRVNRYELFQGASSIQRVRDPGSMLDWVIIDSTRAAIDANERFVAVHAAVVSDGDRAVVMPAAPDSGKTTLGAGLTRSGFRFLGDEVALLDTASGWVHPFLRPLLIEPPSMAVLTGLLAELPVECERFRHRRYQVTAEDLRPDSTGVPCPVGFVVLPAYRPRSATQVRPVSRAKALMRLGEQTFNRARIGRAGIGTLADVVAGAECFELPIGDLDEAILAVRSLFSRTAEGDHVTRLAGAKAPAFGT